MLLYNCLWSLDEFYTKFYSLNANFYVCMQTLGYILIAKPEFMLQTDILNLIEASLSSGVDYRMKV
jgi:hypothetical protein